MTENSEEKKAIPPYLPYKTFLNLVEKLKIGIPSRIDRSVMSTFSGAAQAQLQSTLKYLNLISANGIPTERLQKLVGSEGRNREIILHAILTSSFPFLFGNEIDLKRTTFSHLQEVFENAGGITGGTVRKCIAFFVAMAKDAGIELSPHLRVKGTGSRTVTRKANTERNVRVKSDMPLDEGVPQTQMGTQRWEHLLLSKFPNFDPAWSDDVKSKWFDAFDQLMKRRKESE